MTKKKCVKGWGCGNTCISRTRNCKSNTGEDGKKLIENFMQYLQRTQTPGDVANEPKLEDLKPVKAPEPALPGKPISRKYSDIPFKPQNEGDVYRNEVLANRDFDPDAFEENEQFAAISRYFAGENSITGKSQIFKATEEEVNDVADSTNLRDVLERENIDIGQIKSTSEILFSVNDSFESGKLVPVEGLSPKELAIRVGNAARLASMEVLDKTPDLTILVNVPNTKDGKGKSRAKLYRRAGFGPLDSQGTQRAIKIGGRIVPLEPNQDLTALQEPSDQQGVSLDEDWAVDDELWALIVDGDTPAEDDS